MLKRVLAKSTRLAYEYALTNWYAFSHTNESTIWRNGKRFEKTLLQYIDDFEIRQYSPVSVRREICGIQYKFGHDAITKIIRDRLAQYDYENGRPPNKAEPIDVEVLKQLVAATSSQRNRTILSVAWAGALRASEVCCIKRSDLKRRESGYELCIPHSKTDQLSKGRTIPLPYYHLSHAAICPAKNLDAYLIQQMDLFEQPKRDDPLWKLTTRQIARILKRSTELAGLGVNYTTHSLRRGMVTEAARHAIDDRTIMRHGRWSTRESVDGYVEAGTLWQRTALDFLR